MRPSVILLGFVLGTAASILFSLVAVAIIFLVLEPRHPRLAAEFGSLTVNIGFFAALTAFSGLSFYAVLKDRRWKVWALVPTCLTLAAIAWFYWPE